MCIDPSLHFAISYILWSVFSWCSQPAGLYKRRIESQYISRRINVIIHMCVCIIDDDFHFAQIFHILSRSTTDFCYFRWGFFSARHSEYEHVCSISNIIDSKTTKLTLPSSHTDFHFSWLRSYLHTNTWLQFNDSISVSSRQNNKYWQLTVLCFSCSICKFQMFEKISLIHVN